MPKLNQWGLSDRIVRSGVVGFGLPPWFTGEFFVYGHAPTGAEKFAVPGMIRKSEGHYGESSSQD
ncbi:MAG: hypothetical protein ACM3S0_14475 [Acidobacteriota bacterium]